MTIPRDNRVKRTVLTVFIGSPSDLQAEREETRKVIDGLNRHLARNLGVVVELRGWEDTLPGFSRPQDIINEDVRQSDLFIGLVWRRWGTPTGEYSSGFEEEYVVAIEQRNRRELEDVWLFFKEVPEEMLRDPGEQLRKVQQFKEEVTSRREVLYDNFQSTEEWSTKLFNYLSDYLTKDLGAEESAQVGMTPATDIVSVGGTSENSVEQSMAAVSAALTEGKAEQVRLLQVARAHLASSSMYYMKRRDSQPMGTHENNLLYASRTQIQLTRVEQIYVIRDLAADRDSLKAGWFWLDQTLEQISTVLVAISSSDELENVRLGSLQLIEDIAFDVDLERIESLIDDENILVATLAVKLYSQRAPSALDKLEELTHHRSEEIAGTAWREALRILVRHDAQRAVDWILNSTLSRKPTYIDVLGPLWSADTDVIKPLTEAEEALVRRKAFEEVKASLEDNEVKKLIEDPNVWLRAAAYMELVSRVVEVNEQDVEENLKATERRDFDLDRSNLGRGKLVPTYRAEDVVLLMYKRLPLSDFENMVDWLSPKSPVKYEALATEHFDRFGDVVREDLSQDFCRIREPYYGMLRQVYGEDAESEIEDLKRLEDFVASRFRLSALRVLSERAEPRDVELARSLLRAKHDDYEGRATILAFRILQKYGTTEDIELLKEYIANRDPILKRCAAKSLLDLSQNSGIEHVQYLLDSDDTEVVRISFRWLLSREDARCVEKARKLLYSEADETRVCALSYLMYVLNRSELESLLDDYPVGQYYYYNVICWLDRTLYAPQGLQEEYTRRIKSRIAEPLDVAEYM